ncbi:hypothetical protein KM043_013310 [Ampulex compressa]|nr:hypothetical protein KM043_013310 [Ampulex compressa]
MPVIGPQRFASGINKNHRSRKSLGKTIARPCPGASTYALCPESHYWFLLLSSHPHLDAGQRSRAKLAENRSKTGGSSDNFADVDCCSAALFHVLFPRLGFTKARSNSTNGLDCIPFAPEFLASLLLLQACPASGACVPPDRPSVTL